MTDTSNADDSPDAQSDAPPPSSWTPPRGAPSGLASLAGYASDSGVWNRADGKTPDQPTTIAPPRQFPGIPDQSPPTLAPPAPGDRGPPPIGLSPRHPMPFRPKMIQRYFPPLPNRPWHQWGEPRDFGPEPQPWEVPGIYSNVARFFTNQGSGFTAPTAAMLGVSTQGHSKAYMEGQTAALRILEERMKLNAETLAERSFQEQKDYRDAFALGGGDVGTWSGDPKAKDSTELHDRLMEVATKYNDKPMLAALESGNLQRAENILKERDAQGTSLRESVTQQRKEDDKRKEEAPWREGGTPPAITDSGAEPGQEPAPAAEGGAAPPAPSVGEGEAPPGPTPTAPSATPSPDDQPPTDSGGYTPKLDISQGQAGPQGVQVAQAGASDAPQPGMQRLAAAQAQPDFTPTPSQALQEAANDKDRISGQGFQTEPIEQLARKLVTGAVRPTQKGLPGVPPAVFEYATKRQLEIEKDLDRIQADPKLTGQRALAAIRKVDPQLAEDVAAYTNGSLAPPRGATALKPPWDRVVALGSKVDPTFTGSTFQTRASTLKDFTSGQDGRNLVSIATAYAHLHAVQEDLKNLPGPIASMVGQYRYIGKLAGVSDADRAAIGKLENDVNTAAAEYERALTGGKPTVSGRDEQMSDLDWRTKDVGVVSANIQSKIDRLKERMDRLKTYFSAGVGRQPEDMFKVFDAFSRSGAGRPGADELGPTSGASPGDADVLRDLDRQRSTTPQARSPEDNQALDWARSHPDDPRSKQILEHLGQ